MFRYQVNYERPERYWNGIVRGSRLVEAQTEAQAIAKLRKELPDSFGHWVNRLATELV